MEVRKKEIILFVMAFLILVGVTAWQCKERVYLLDSIVTEIEDSPFGTTVLVEDDTGNLWAFRTENAQLGDKYTLVMDSLGNENLYDDVIELTIKRQ